MIHVLAKKYQCCDELLSKRIYLCHSEVNSALTTFIVQIIIIIIIIIIMAGFHSNARPLLRGFMLSRK